MLGLCLSMRNVTYILHVRVVAAAAQRFFCVRPIVRMIILCGEDSINRTQLILGIRELSTMPFILRTSSLDLYCFFLDGSSYSDSEDLDGRGKKSRSRRRRTFK